MTAAQLRVSGETLLQTVTALDTSFEQTAEKDLVLPDYCPDVFRILKCRACPCVVSQSICGDKLSLETEVTLKVLYLSADSGRINLIEHKTTVSKTLSLGGDLTAPVVSARAIPGNVSCRVVSRRRVDIRGAFTVKVKVTAEERIRAVTDAEGAGIQLKKVSVACPVERLTASKRLTVIEELELGGAKPPVGSVLRTDCRIEISEQRVISGKMMLKGEALIDLLYTPADPESTSLETMRFGLPFSQLTDIDGLDESFVIEPELTVAGCDIIPHPDEPQSLECELVMLLGCTAVRCEEMELVTDAFSTRYECTAVKSDTKLCGIGEKVSLDVSSSAVLTSPDGELEGLSFAACEAGSLTVTDSEEGGSLIQGSLRFFAVGVSDGAPVWLENEVPFEYTSEQTFAGASLEVRSCSYHLTDGNSAELRAELTLFGTVSDGTAVCPLTELSVDTEKPLTRDGRIAVKLCQAEPGEELWELARHFGTSPEAIASENGLNGCVTENGGMLLIPMTD
ncbi:protein of unknown function [Ruminococcaceae bacterium FB2012]|nr:protein of unknown function [Ruminococcaceae bacterium FB2012]